ncbi:ABC transporter substrate-binding protein [Micromonospora cremea]|uniref:Iron(III) transport system substrate-binding protein n=1 Tax=Micromonospora cremea TaxID=709881 RepID=A0A1N5VID3_9ACTN|nr:extracellular solute-binding protein [Micromonospora cremea]SIM72466.1 iron(III) transport system substrate-binding protein [Micromonospora cremea]
MRLRLARIGAALIGCTLLATACGSGDSSTAATDEAGRLVVNGEVIADAALLDAAKAEGRVSLYTAYLQDVAQKFTDDFTKQTGIDVESVRLTPTQLQERTISEGGAKLLGADVIQTSDPLNNSALVDAGVIKCDVLDEAFTATIDDRYLDPKGCAYPTTVSTMVIAYNTAVLGSTTPPKTWQDLLKPEYKGKIGVLIAGVGGSAWSNFMYLREKFGVEYWENLAAQNVKIQTSSATLGPQVERGEIPIGIVSASTAMTSKANGAPVDFVLPSDGLADYGTYTLLSEPSVVKDSHPNAAQLFRNWLYSKAGQESVAAANGGAWAVRTDAAAPEGLPAYTDLPMVVLDLDQWRRVQEDWVAEWNDIFNYQAN